MQKKRGGTIMKKKWIILPAAALLCGLFACVQITVVAPEEKTPNKADTEQVSITEVSGPEAPAPEPEAQKPAPEPVAPEPEQTEPEPEPEAQAPASEPVFDWAAYRSEANAQDADPAGKRRIVYDNLCWNSTDVDGSPDFDIIDSTHMTIAFPDWPGFSDLSVFVENETDGELKVPVDQQNDFVLTWNGDMAVITMTEQARTAHYSVEFGDEFGYALVMDFIYGRDGDSVRSVTPGWMDIPLGLFNGSWDSEFYLTASEDAFFLGTKKDDPFARPSYTMGRLSFNELYIDASDADAPKYTHDPFKAGELVIETEELIRDGGRFDVMSIRCGDRYIAVNEDGAIVFTTDRDQRALWMLG